MLDLKDKPIWGVAILDRELFVLTQTTSKIDVYNTKTFVFKRRILTTLVNPRDIVSCSRNRCLYVIDWKEKFTQKEIARLDPSGVVIREWVTGEDKGLLSISSDAKIILTVTKKRMLKEYSPEGQLIREVSLSPDASSPWHAVKLTNNNFVVSKDDDRLHTVSVVDSDGQTVQSFIREGDTNLKGSVHVVVDRGGTVLLADTFKKRVLLLSPDLHYKRVLLSKSHGLNCPVRMQLDESSGRLFVVDNEYDYFSRGKWRDGRILVFDIGKITEENVRSSSMR